MDSSPSTEFVGFLVEGFVSLSKLWSILVVVLWSSNGPDFLGGWIDLLSIVSDLLDFLLGLLESLAHLREDVELHEVLGESTVAIGVTILAVIRSGEAGDRFVVVIRVGFGRGDVGALGLGGVSSPLSAVVGTIAEGSAVSIHETIVGEVLKGIVKGDGVLRLNLLGNLLLVGRVVAEVDERVFRLGEDVGEVLDGDTVLGWCRFNRDRSDRLQGDELGNLSGGVGSTSSDFEDLLIGLIVERVRFLVEVHELMSEKTVNILVTVICVLKLLEHFVAVVFAILTDVAKILEVFFFHGTEDLNLVVFVKVEEDGLFEVFEVGEHYLN